MSKRFNLREFQQDLLARIHAQSTIAGQGAVLGVQVGASYYLLDMQDIAEVLPVPLLTVVPLTQAWYCGVANVRGNLYGVVDLCAYLGQGETRRESEARVLLLSAKFAFGAGFLVARVLGLRDASAWQQVECDGVLCSQDEAGRTWRKLDVVGLLQQPEFLQIGT
jgi:twitching motility protein PilI